MGLKITSRFVAILVILSLCIATSCDKEKSDKILTIAVAANVQYAIDPIISAFTNQTGIECQKVVGSSGKLSALITQGVPYDVFLSADMRYPRELHKNGHAQSPPTTYAMGQLVLWSNDKQQELTLSHLPSLQFIAIANPEVAPYGRAAIQALQSAGLYTKIKDKLVYGESVSQAAQYAFTGAAQLAIISRSLAMSSTMRDQGHWTTIEEDLHRPIDQGAIVVSRKAKQTEYAKSFITFLLSPEVQKQLQEAGYIAINNE